MSSPDPQYAQVQPCGFLRPGLLVSVPYPLLNILNITPVHVYNFFIFFGKISVKGTSYSAIQGPHIKIYMINFTWHSELRMINNFML